MERKGVKNMSKLNDMIMKLEQAGVDTSQFTIILNDGTKLVDKGNHCDDVQLQNKTFRRWITAQTFRMLYGQSYNAKKHRYETGWYNYLKNNYDYMYQFKVIQDELKVLSKLEWKSHSDDFVDRSSFFNKEVIIQTCEDCCNKISKVIGEYATVHQLKTYITAIRRSETYEDIERYFIKFYNVAIRYSYMLKHNTKCSVWLDAYKGAGAFYSLQNMIFYHDCDLPGCVNAKEKQYVALRNILQSHVRRGEVWKMHDLLLKTIDYNHFNLAMSIQKRK